MTYATQVTRGKFVRALLPKASEYFPSQGIKTEGDDTWHIAKCPFHNDTKRSLSINIEKGAYCCTVCGANGRDDLAFHQHKHGLNFVEACKQLGSWVHL